MLCLFFNSASVFVFGGILATHRLACMFLFIRSLYWSGVPGRDMARSLGPKSPRSFRN